MNDKQPTGTAIVQQKRTVSDLINGERMRQEIARVLPKHLTPERMTRVALTSIMRNPLLMQCTAESITNSMMILSQAGLEPDGRLAHLIPYWNSKKNCYECQVIFDYKGLITLALRNGAESCFGDKVCEFDEFSAYVEDGIKKITHKPNWKGNRGTVVAFYCVCKRNGEIDYEVMSVDEVEAIRKRSRAGNNGPWVTDYDEMGKKCPVRRMSKRWDLLPEIRDIINKDDDTPEPFGQVTTTAPLFSPKLVAAPEPEAPTEPEAPQPDPVPEDESNPELMPEKPAPVTKATPNYLKGVRQLCAAAKVKEGELLEFTSQIGMSDGSAASLEDLALTNSNALKLIFYNWSDKGEKPGISTQIIAARKGAK
jgi:recombination protein RecT